MANTVLSVFNLKKTFELEPIFEGVSFQLNEGEKVALVGVNGAGKTTILEIIAGIDSPDTGGGNVVRARGLRVAYLPQEVSGFGQIAADHQLAPETTLWEAMLDALGDVSELQRQMNRLEEQMSEPGVEGAAFDDLLARYEEVTEKFERAGGYELEHKVEQVLEGLGFTRAQFELPIAKLSGGQKTRAALGRSLLADPDLLLLDEPTNHLDLTAIEWLEAFLGGWRGTMLCSSHDRRFLDKVTTRTLELELGRLEEYPGNYTKYLALKADRVERRMFEYQQQQEYVARQQEFIRRYKNSQKSRQAKGREKRLNRMERLQAPRSTEQLKLELKAHVRSGRSVLAVEDLEVGFLVPLDGEHPAAASTNGSGAKEELRLIRTPDLEIERGERVALIGPNGSGKTSLLRTILGEIEPLGGEVIVGHNVNIAYYAQAHEGLNPAREIIDEIMMARPMSEEAARSLLGRFLFSGDDVYKRIGDLSGGERSRVALAKLTLANANFLLLDEPTNHLDLGAREALEDVLSEYQGTMLFVSHDRAFIDSLATQMWVVENERVEAFDGNYSDYQEELARRRREGMLPEVEKGRGTGAKQIVGPVALPGTNGKGHAHAIPKGIPGGQQARRDQRAREEADRAAARARAVAERQLRDIESSIAELEARLNMLSGELEAASAAGDIALVADVGREYQSLADELEAKYSAWEVLAQ